MPIAHLIHGYLGAGKTTFAQHLEKETSAIRFTHDEWMRKLYGDDPPEHLFADRAQRVFELMETIWTRCLTIGVDVILDFGFWSRKERDRARAVIGDLGAEYLLYRLACPDEVAWRRIEERNVKAKVQSLVAPNTFEILKARFEPLGLDEDRIEIGSDGWHSHL